MWRPVTLLALSVLLLPASGISDQSISALDPVDVYADGFDDLRGIGVDDEGNVFVADRVRGTLTRIAPDRSRSVVAGGLERPVGVALDRENRPIVAEERAGRVVRVERSGLRTVLAAGIQRPRWLAVAEDGTVFVSARRPTDDAGTASDPDDESVEPEAILVLRPTGALDLLADGFQNLQGLATSGRDLFAATQGLRGDAGVDGAVYHIPILADGTAGAPVRLGPSDRYKKPVGLVQDVLGALYITTREVDLVEDRSRRAVLKLGTAATATLHSENLEQPQGVALDAAGSLYVADGRSGRVLRFHAPPPPAITSPEIIGQLPYALAGTTVPGARVDLFIEGTMNGGVFADAAGAFGASVALRPDAPNTLEAFATSHGGRGLTSGSTSVTIVHDGLAPALAFQAPAAGAHVRGSTDVRLQATDAGTGVQTFALAADAQALAVTVTPALPAPSATAALAWDTLAGGDGPRTLRATAGDRAGNAATRTRVVIVDNTPPATQITDGPGGIVSATTASFAFAGSDNLTPAASLVFAWRLDDAAWSPFGPGTTAVLTGLAAGPHSFEVRARDLAGNEDPAPARRAFTVSSGAVQIAIADPADGSTVGAGALLVRGAVAADGAEVGVTVNGVAAAVHGGSFAASLPLPPGTHALTAIATTSGGASATHSVTVTVTGGGASLTALPQSGLAPLSVSFRLDATRGATITLDADGDGATDFSGASLDGRTFTFSRPGLYFPVATLTDGGGNQSTARTVVQVHDRAAVDASLKAKWAALRSALMANDLAAAVAHFAAPQQDRYRALFSALAADIPQIARDMQDIELIYASEGRAKYRLPRTQVWGGQLVDLAYYVYFVQDGDGLWVIESF